MKMTINELMSAKNQIIARKTELERLRASSSTTETKSYNGEVTKTESVYNAKILDRQITTIQNWLYKITAEIHSLNSKTVSELEVPVEELLAPVE